MLLQMLPVLDLYPTFLIISQIIELLKHLPNVANKSNSDKWQERQKRATSTISQTQSYNYAYGI